MYLSRLVRAHNTSSKKDKRWWRQNISMNCYLSEPVGGFIRDSPGRCMFSTLENTFRGKIFNNYYEHQIKWSNIVLTDNYEEAVSIFYLVSSQITNRLPLLTLSRTSVYWHGPIWVVKRLRIAVPNKLDRRWLAVRLSLSAYSCAQ